MVSECNWHEEPRIVAESHGAGRYLLREEGAFKSPFEARILEWSEGGRVKVRYQSGHESWLEGSDIPFLVEALPDEDQPQ